LAPHPAFPDPSIRPERFFCCSAGSCLRHSGEKASIIGQAFIEEAGVTSAFLPVSWLKVEFCKSRASLSLIDLPGRALGVQHSARYEVVQGRLLWVARLGFG
jgi:hypothetical protein